MTPAIERTEPKWPVIEIFGPTIQGEGIDAGAVSHFVRFGGCDYRCDWCDTPYAVVPSEVRANATKMTPTAIADELARKSDAPWIILTGGNPALHDLAPLVDQLHAMHYLVAVETQGSRWRDWMFKVDRLCVSPKPPSAFANASAPTGASHPLPDRWAIVHRFLDEAMQARTSGERDYHWMFLKVPVFDDADLDWVERLRSQLSDAPLYLSAGNDAGRTVGNPTRKDTRRLAGIRRDLLERYEWLVAEVFKRPELCRADVIVQAQQHVLLWGNEPGR